jgi:Cell Wall Hydrolase
MGRTTVSSGPDWIIAATIATEVPPLPKGPFTAAMIPIAIRAVSDVIRNRAASLAFPSNPVLVVLQHNQFSAVCREEYWQKALAGEWQPQHVLRCLREWQTPQAPVAPGALYYYSPVSMVPPGREPSWVKTLTRVPVAGLDESYFRFFK